MGTVANRTFNFLNEGSLGQNSVCKGKIVKWF